MDLLETGSILMSGFAICDVEPLSAAIRPLIWYWSRIKRVGIKQHLVSGQCGMFTYTKSTTCTNVKEPNDFQWRAFHLEDIHIRITLLCCSLFQLVTSIYKKTDSLVHLNEDLKTKYKSSGDRTAFLHTRYTTIPNPFNPADLLIHPAVICSALVNDSLT